MLLPETNLLFFMPTVSDGYGFPPGLNDGPLPAHYEPIESPVRNPIYPERQSNPVATDEARVGNEYATSPDERFPYVLTTYRVTEHHTAGGMSRTLSHLAELQPELFCEISVELAEQLSIIPRGVGDHSDRARSHRSSCPGDA